MRCRLDLACRGERQGLGHVVTRADEGAADGDAADHHVEERHRERARRQPHEHARAAAAGHAQTLRERAQGGRRDEHAVCAAAGGPRDRRGGVADGGRIHDGVGAAACGVRQRAVVDVHGAHLRVRTHRLPRREAVLAAAAGRVQPRHAHAADAFMAGHEGQGGRDRPVAARRGLRPASGSWELPH